jgi:hypothetical protein
MESYPFSPAIADLYFELMDDPLRCAGPGELESDEPLDYCEPTDSLFFGGEFRSYEPPFESFDFESFERQDRLNDREWEEEK